MNEHLASHPTVRVGPRWEHLKVAPYEGRPRWVNDQELPEWRRGPLWYQYLEQLGDAGWELVSTLLINLASNRTDFYFKRPKLDPRPGNPK